MDTRSIIFDPVTADEAEEFPMGHAGNERIVVVGLGYVGLPLAVSLARSFETFGLDINATRVGELSIGHDRTDEVETSLLSASTLRCFSEPSACPQADTYIVTVPTPVDRKNRPDLRALIAASEMVGRLLAARTCNGVRLPLVIFESTVYPGVTEEICVPSIERSSGLKWRDDFVVGYSPERINPGDREHTVDRIVKVVSGDGPETIDRVSALYGKVTTGGTFRAASIKAAEGAKVIENAQRDVNIAFMNEITRIFARLDVSIWDVLEAAKTKWNFLPFTPGLVGGHCIGVDPYYLSHRAIELGHLPEVIPAARSVNDDMARWIADTLHFKMDRHALRILILGVTFKEDVPDLRNSKVGDIVKRFWYHGHSVTVHDPYANAQEAAEDYGVRLDPDALTRSYDLVVAAVSHRKYREMDDTALAALVDQGGLFADVKGAFRARAIGRAIWTL